MAVRSICWNYGDSSPALCIGFGKAKLLDLLTEDLKNVNDQYKESKVCDNC